MAESEIQNEGGIATVTQPEMIRITLNNEEVEVPNIPEVVEKLKQAEHNLKSGYGKLLEKERAELNAEKQKMQQYLDEDIKFLTTHDPEDYEHYAAKTIYGEDGGFKPPKDRERKMDTNNTVVESSAELKAMQEKIKRLEDTLSQQVTVSAEEAKNQAELALTKALKEFKNADKDTVVDRMTSYFFVNKGRHPSPEQVREYVRLDHERVAKSNAPAGNVPIETQRVADRKPAMPEPGRAAPDTTPEKKNIPLWDVDAQLSDYKEFKKNQTGG